MAIIGLDGLDDALIGRRNILSPAIDVTVVETPRMDQREIMQDGYRSSLEIPRHYPGRNGHPKQPLVPVVSTFGR